MLKKLIIIQLLGFGLVVRKVLERWGIDNKKRGPNTSYTFPRYRQTPEPLYMSKSPRYIA